MLLVFIYNKETQRQVKKTIQRLDLLNTLLIRNWQQSMQEKKTEKGVCVCVCMLMCVWAEKKTNGKGKVHTKEFVSKLNN